MPDAGLLLVAITALAVNRAEDLAWIVVIHKGTGPKIDALPGQGHIVGVHDPVDKSKAHPLGNQLGLALTDLGQQRQWLVHPGIVALTGKFEQAAQVLGLAPGGQVLKRAHSQMTGGHPGQDRTGLWAQSGHGLAGLNDGQRAGAGHA